MRVPFRATIVLLFFALPGSKAWSQADAAERPRPNILFAFADDWGAVRPRVCGLGEGRWHQ